MKRKVLSMILVFTMILSLMSPIFAEDTTTQGPRVSVECHPYTVTNNGTEFEIEVFVKNVQDLYGAAVSIKYDPNIFEVVEDSPNAPFDDRECILHGFGDEADTETGVGDYFIGANNYDTDPTIMHYAITGIGNVAGFNVPDSWGKIVEVSLRVKDTYKGPDHSIDFDTVHSIDELHSSQITNAVAVEFANTNDTDVNNPSANVIDFESSEEDEGTIEIYFENEINGQISLNWEYPGNLDLNGNLMVPPLEGEEEGPNIGAEDNGSSNEYPWAVFLHDEATYYNGENDYNNFAQEEILYNKLLPGSKYVVLSSEGMDLAQIRNEVNTSMKVYLDDTHNFDINNASGTTGSMWHVFDVTDDDNDGTVEIVTVNEITNDVSGDDDPYDPGDDEEPEIDCWTNWDDGVVSVEGYVYYAVTGYNTVELYINGSDVADYTGSISKDEDSYNYFKFDDISSKLQTGLNILKVEYKTGIDSSISNEFYEIYNAHYLDTTPLFDDSLGKYSGDVEIEVFKDQNIIVSNFDLPIYGELLKINPVDYSLQNIDTLTFNLSDDKDKYSAVIDKSNINKGNKYIIEFYSDSLKTTQIGIGYFGVDVKIVVLSDWWNDDAESQDVTLTGYIAFADEELAASDGFEVSINGAAGIPINLEGTSFSTDITLGKGNNLVELNLYKNDPNRFSHRTSSCVFVEGEDEDDDIYYQPTALGYEFFIDADDISTIEDTLYCKLYQYDEIDETYYEYTGAGTVQFDENIVSNEFVATYNDILPLGEYMIEMYENDALSGDPIYDTYCYINPMVHVESPGLHDQTDEQPIDFTGFISNYDSNDTDTYLEFKFSGDVTDITSSVNDDGSFTVSNVSLINGFNFFKFIYTVPGYYTSSDFYTSTWGKICYGDYPLGIHEMATDSGYEFSIYSLDLDVDYDEFYGKLLKDGQPYLIDDNQVVLPFTEKETYENGSYELCAQTDADLDIGYYTVDLFSDAALSTYEKTGEFYMSPMVHLTYPQDEEECNSQDIYVNGYISNYDSDSYNNLILFSNVINDYTGMNITNYIDTSNGSFSAPLTLTEYENFIELSYEFDYQETEGDNMAFANSVYCNPFKLIENWVDINTNPDNPKQGQEVTLQIPADQLYDDSSAYDDSIYGKLFEEIEDQNGETLRYDPYPDEYNYYELNKVVDGDKVYYSATIQAQDIEMGCYNMKLFSDNLFEDSSYLGEGEFDVYDPSIDAPVLTLSSPRIGQVFTSSPIIISGNVTGADVETSYEMHPNEDDIDNEYDLTDIIDENGDFTTEVAIKSGFNGICVRSENHGGKAKEYRMVFLSSGNINAPEMLPLEDQDGIWHDGVLEQAELQGENGIYLDVNLNGLEPNSGDYVMNLFISSIDETDKEELEFVHNVPITSDQVTSSGTYKNFISLSDINLSENITYSAFSQIVEVNQNDGFNEENVIDASHYSGSIQFTYEESVIIKPDLPVIVTLASQTEKAWEDSNLTLEELNAITLPENYPCIRLDVDVSDGLELGTINNGKENGYFIDLSIIDSEGFKRCITNQIIKDGNKTYIMVPKEALLGANLLDEGEYNLVAQIVFMEQGELSSITVGSNESEPISFVYNGQETQSSDATLSDLTIDGPLELDFKSDTLNYEVTLPAGTIEVPTVSATKSNPNATVDITQATGLPGTATVVVIAEDGVNTKTYTVDFTIEQLSLPVVTVGNDKGLTGDIIQIPITISEIPENWNSYEIELNFNKTILTVNSITNGDVFDSITPNYDNTAGKAYISTAQASAATSGSTIVNIEFQINNEASLGVSDLTLEPNALFLSDTSFAEIDASISNGYIDVIDVIYGDVTGDGRVRSNDAAAVLMSIVGLVDLDSNQMLAADVTGDGRVRSNDAAAILMYIVHSIDAFPVEGN